MFSLKKAPRPHPASGRNGRSKERESLLRHLERIAGGGREVISACLAGAKADGRSVL